MPSIQVIRRDREEREEKAKESDKVLSSISRLRALLDDRKSKKSARTSTRANKPFSRGTSSPSLYA